MPEESNIEVFDYATLKKKDNYIKIFSNCAIRINFSSNEIGFFAS